MTLKVLIDSCVWLDLARDHRMAAVVGALEHLVETKEIELIVPEIVIEEFTRNKDRIIADAKKSLQSQFRLVRDTISRFADDDYKDATLAGLGEVDRKIFIKGEAVEEAVAKIEALLRSVPGTVTTPAIKQRVTERALAMRAPYHRAKNSVADAILIEIYADLRSRAKDEFAFVTHNTKDFSEPGGDHRRPHPDLADLFAGRQSTYWIALVDLIRERHGELLDDVDAEFNYVDEPRRLSEILDAEALLFRQIWYNRHWNLRTAIEAGRHKVVSKEEADKHPELHNVQTVDTVWAQALAAAKRTEDEVGADKLGPWSDFEWGMLNGKLSALRWVLGDEWDFLDT